MKANIYKIKLIIILKRNFLIFGQFKYFSLWLASQTVDSNQYHNKKKKAQNLAMVILALIFKLGKR